MMTPVADQRIASGSSAAVRRPGDRFLWAVPLLAFCCGIILTALTYFERVSGGSLILALFLFVLIVVALLVVAALALVRGRIKWAAALLIAPFILGLPYFSPILEYEEIALDLMRFHLTKGKYAKLIDGLSPAERASRIVIFPWGTVGLAVSASTEYWLVYDESGEIALPENQRSQDWKDRANKEKGYFSDEKCVAEARRLSGHFYSAAMHCPR